MPAVEINGKMVHYGDEGEGEVLLMGHSYLWDHHMWDEMIELLRGRYRCIAPDLWGHGKSGLLTEEPFSLSDLADDYLQLMDKLDIDEFTIVGLSVGGMWGTEMALKKPDAVKALILIDTYVGEEPTSSQAQYFGMLNMVESLGAIPEPMIEELLPIFLSPATIKRKPQVAHNFRGTLRAFTKEQIPTIVKLGRAIFERRELLGVLGEISIPSLIIVGEDDRPRPVSEAMQMAERIKDATSVIIPDAGHISAKEQPEALYSAIIKFLAKEKSVAAY